VLLETGTRGLKDLLAPGFPALVGEPRHEISVAHKQKEYSLLTAEGMAISNVNEYSFGMRRHAMVDEIGTSRLRGSKLQGSKPRVRSPRITSPRASSPRASNTTVTVVVCIALGAVAAAMASLNVAIPGLVRSTHASQTQLEWIIDAYLLVFSVLLLPAGALGDRYGRRRALFAGLVIFGAASAVAMMISSASALIVLRGLIGAGAALVMPATLSTITGTFPPAERTRAVGVWAGVAGGSAVLGLLCTGILLEWFSWRAAFAVNVVLAAVAIAGTVRFVPESSQPDAPPVDKGGTLLATVGLVALVFSIIEAPDAGWLSGRTLGGMAAGLAALAGFVLFELRQRHPLLDPRLFSNRKLAAGSLSILIQFFAFFGFTFVSLQYLQGVRGYSPLIAALAVLPLTAAMMPTSRVTATAVSRFGARAVCVTGLLLVAAGLAVISRVGTGTPYWLMLAGLVPLGIGMGAAMTPATSAITEALPQAQQGVGSALNDLSREVGGALGTAVLGSIVTAVYRSSLQLPGVPAPLAHQAQQSFAIAIHAGGPVGTHARTAFVDGIHTGLLYAAGAAVIAAISVATLLSRDAKIRRAAGRSEQPQLACVAEQTTAVS
jgi:EmrB/QacA subfamily drug resistance transporter